MASLDQIRVELRHGIVDVIHYANHIAHAGLTTRNSIVAKSQDKRGDSWEAVRGNNSSEKALKTCPFLNVSKVARTISTISHYFVMGIKEKTTVHAYSDHSQGHLLPSFLL